MNYSTLYLFLCIVFVGKGDDRWNERSKDIIESDIEILQEPEGIERDSSVENSNYGLAKQDRHNNDRYKHTKLRTKLSRGSLKQVKSKRMGSILPSKINNGIYSLENTKNVSEEFSLDLFKLYNLNKNHSNHIIDTIPKWPKFEDLLLSIGVEYDWKSDRWIKIKNKVTKISDEDFKFFNKHKEVSHKHEFKYRTVRINGSKNRKNVIIAVTAVR